MNNKIKIPKELLKRNPFLFFKSIFYFLLMILCVIIIINNNSLIINLLLSVVLGSLIGAHGFFVHELLHGAVVKNKKLQTIYALIGYAPYLMTPTYWRYWHNYLHHNNTQIIGKDPDMLPSGEFHEKALKKSIIYKIIYKFLPNSESKIRFFYCFIWMNVQAFLGHVFIRFNGKQWKNLNQLKVTFEWILQIFLIISYCYLIGSQKPLFLIVIPFLIQNYTIMSFIVTNHFLSKSYREGENFNDLEISHNIKLNKFYRFYYFNFGYHTEHHLFPNAPSTSLERINKIVNPPNVHNKYDLLYKIFFKKI
jgi:fatty acid desaturase